MDMLPFAEIFPCYIFATIYEGHDAYIFHNNDDSGFWNEGLALFINIKPAPKYVNHRRNDIYHLRYTTKAKARQAKGGDFWAGGDFMRHGI